MKTDLHFRTPLRLSSLDHDKTEIREKFPTSAVIFLCVEHLLECHTVYGQTSMLPITTAEKLIWLGGSFHFTSKSHTCPLAWVAE
jgi:hypothetical protein